MSDTPAPDGNKVGQLDSARSRKQKQRAAFTALVEEVAILAQVADGSQPVGEILEHHDILARAGALSSGYDVDVARQIVAVFGLHAADIPNYKRAIAEERALTKAPPARAVVELAKAVKPDYFALFSEIFGELRRDMFTGNLLFLNDERIWVPAINYLPLIKSRAADCEENGLLRFTQSLLEPRLKDLENSTARQLIPEIPEWDGKDRLKVMAHALVLDGTQEGFDSDLVETFVKDWISKCWGRLWSPALRNKILILKSKKQRIGKDWWIDTLTGGFGQWSSNMTITHNEVDNQLQLSHSAVLKISEFDRTAKKEVAQLKSLVTLPDSKLRESYGKAAEFRKCRCSFISSCNVDDIFRDETGHDRFLPFNLASIDWNYPRTAADSLQMLAQARHLFDAAYSAPSGNELILSRYLDGVTPTPMHDQVAESFNDVLYEWLEGQPALRLNVRKAGFIANDYLVAGKILESVGRKFGKPESWVRHMLHLARLDRRKGKRRERGYLVTVYEEGADEEADEADGWN